MSGFLNIWNICMFGKNIVLDWLGCRVSNLSFDDIHGVNHVEDENLILERFEYLHVVDGIVVYIVVFHL